MATSGPVPSKDPSDMLFNAQKLDEVVNGSSPTYTTRLGVVRKTVVGYMAKMDDQVDLVEAARATAVNTTIPGQVALVTAAKNTAINVSIPAAVALVDTAVAQTAAGSATAAKLAAQAAQAATETARDLTEAAARVFTTTALGLAGTSNGQLFGVKQPYGDAVDVYLNSSGTAVAQGQTIPWGVGKTLEAIQIAERNLTLVPPYPYTPIFEMCAIDQFDKNGKYLKNRRSSAAPSGNLMQVNSGIPAGLFGGSGLTLSNYYATGPAGLQTAIRAQINNGYHSLLGTIALPAGNHTIRFRAKSTAGKGSQDFKFGRYNTDAVTATVTEAGWTPVVKTITSDGVARHYAMIFSDGGTTPTNLDILYDEVQVYEGNSIPVAYSAEAHTPHAFRLNYVAGAYAATGGDVTVANVAQANPSAITLPSFPQKTTFTAMTYIALAQPTAEVPYSKILTHDAGFPQFWIGAFNGSLTGSPVIGPFASGGGPGIGKFQYAIGRYPRIIASRFNATERVVYINGIPLKATTGLSPISVATLGLFGDNTGVTAGSIPGQSAFVGVCNDALVFDQSLTDAQVQSACDIVRQKYLLEKGVDIYRTENWWIAEGDSITAYAESYQKLFFDTLRDKWYGANIAQDGSVHFSAAQRLPLLLKTIAGCLRNGYRPIVSYFMGANGLSTLQNITDFSTAVRGAGGRLIICTPLPKGSDATWETNRLANRSMMLANPSLYDGVADFGDPATTMGAFGSPTTNAGTLWIDTIHPNAAGQALLEAIIRPVVLAQGV